MKNLAALLLLLSVVASSRADSTVVFNEIMYHPATNEVEMEWVELHNQMAADMDLSGWFLSGGIRYTFAEGTIVRGGGYLVLGVSPAALAAATGLTNIYGPFEDRLSNGGEMLELRDKNDRMMDVVSYGDKGKWPVAPDGSGVSLAKRDQNSASDAPENWTSSVVVGGTPGASNFLESNKKTQIFIGLDSLWRSESSGTDLGLNWRAPEFNDSAWAGLNSAQLVSYWPFDGNAEAVKGTGGSLVGGPTPTTDRNGVAGGALSFTGTSQQYVEVPGGGGLNAAPEGTISLWVKWTGTQDADCCGSFGAVIARQSNGQFSDNVIALSGANPATAKPIWKQTATPALLTGKSNVLSGVWHHVAVTFSSTGSQLFVDGLLHRQGAGSPNHDDAGVPLTIGAWTGDGAGYSTSSIDDVAIWDKPLTADQIFQLAAQTKSPLDFAARESAIYFAGDGRVPEVDDLRHSELPLGPTTYYFRKTFTFDDNPAQAELFLSTAVDDGAVFYLNGVELYRQNMPAGAVAYSTLAAAAIGDASLHPDLPVASANLRRGTNVLAVEVHQAALADEGMVFGAGLRAVIDQTPAAQGSTLSPSDFLSGDLVFNEVTAATTNPFQLEIVNSTDQPIDLAGMVIKKLGTPLQDYVLPAQSLPGGGFLVLTGATLGFTPKSGDLLFLYRAGKVGVLDALEVTGRHQGRSPDGTGAWLFPNAPTFGAGNMFTFHDEVVVNEIMYHHRPTLAQPATFSSTNLLLNVTNVWKYHQLGQDLGTDWRLNNYADADWLSGPALFYVTSSALPAPKNTALSLTNSTGAKVLTYYFRTQFSFDGDTNGLWLMLRPVVDDGAVFYLNGNEILRLNLPAGNTTYSTPASTSISTIAFTGPFRIASSNLLAGPNVLAVEVHKFSPADNDVVFGAELLALKELAPAIEYSASPEEWIELFNRSSLAVNLTGWKLDDAISYAFAANTVLAPGGYLVVARNAPALRAKYPEITIVGNYSGGLGNTTDHIVLLDAADNPVDKVRYYDNGRWPEHADGGGPSLELRDPQADNSVAETWAASDEGSKAAWQTYSYRGVAQASPVGPDGQWKEFVFGLLDSGEVLIDDLSVVESPGGTPVQLLKNGTFTTGATSWRIIGNHHGEVIDDPDNPGNKVLRLVSVGQTEHMSNHAETTLANNRDTVNGREYEISFRAKWIAGCRQLHTRLYFNRLARTTVLQAAERHGTPGKQNSNFEPNIGPTFRNFRHAPPVPAPFQPVTISVAVTDPEGVMGCTLFWAVNGTSWLNKPMAAEPGGLFTAELPGLPAGTVVQFYVCAQDGLAAQACFPAAGPVSRALYKVDDGLAAKNGLHNFRMIVTPQDGTILHATINLMSNDRIGTTVIYDEKEIFYDMGLRLKGSEHSRTTPERLGFNVRFNSQQLFRGVHHTLALDRSESTFFGQREMLSNQTINHAGGIPTKYNDLIQMMTPLRAHTGSAELQMARYTDVFLDSQFADGGDGMLFEYELVYQLNSTINGSPEGAKVPAPDSVVGTPIVNLGNDKENYRWNFLIKNNTERDDYARLMQFAKTMGLSGAAFNTQITNIIDVDQWLRCFAVSVMCGAGDNYGADGSQHNHQLFVHPNSGKVMFFPHDLDAFYDATRAIDGNGDLVKLLSTPAYARLYYQHLRDIIATTYNGSYMGYWSANFGRLLPAQPFASHLAFIVQRSNFILSQINTRSPKVPFSITSNNGADFLTNRTPVLIKGTAWLDVKEIRLAGSPAPIELVWTAANAWQTTVPLILGTNLLTFVAYDFKTNQIGTDSITVTCTVPGGGTDSDGDGIPDAWEVANGLDPARKDAAEDPDKDGLTNGEEYLAGTDPKSAGSALRLLATLDPSGPVKLLSTAVAGRTYTVQASDGVAPASWINVINIPARGTNRVVETEVLATEGRRFFRLITPQVP